MATFAACGPSASLNDVEKYATLGQQAKASFDAIADDYDASCARQRELEIDSRNLTWMPYVPTTTDGEATPSTTGAAPGASSTNRMAASKPTPKRTPFFGAQSQETCVVTEGYADYPLGAVSKDWKHANDTLLTYIQALGAIASVTATPSPAISPLIGAAVKAKLIPAAQATSIAAFSGALITWLQKNQREHDAAKFIEAVNAPDPTTKTAPFADAMVALEIAGASYQTLIFNECTETSNLYEDALVNLQTAGARSDPLVAERAHTIRQRWASDLTNCDTRQGSASGYLATLKKLSAANDALVAAERGSTFSRAALTQDMSDASDSVSSLYTLLFSKPASATSAPRTN